MMYHFYTPFINSLNIRGNYKCLNLALYIIRRLAGSILRRIYQWSFTVLKKQAMQPLLTQQPVKEMQQKLLNMPLNEGLILLSLSEEMVRLMRQFKE